LSAKSQPARGLIATHVFIDTNIFLYAASEDPTEAAKAKIACDLIEREQFGISLQVIQEFYVNAVGKLARKIPPHKLLKILAQPKQQEIAPLSVEFFDAAVALRDRYQLSYWDAAIIAAAKELGARTVYSEDLAHGQVYDGITVVNPFL
jgi:predicted nucleic acid-binding protein